MPNIALIQSLRQKYQDIKIDYSEELDGSVNDKGLLNPDSDTRTRNNTKSTAELRHYFDNCEEQKLVLLYIDITGFSNEIKHWTNDKLKRYLDHYYRIAFNIIYDHLGEIEKVIGDGIICMFGTPFIESKFEALIIKAQLCAQALLETFLNTEYSIKIAIHCGIVKYHKIHEGNYIEYTMIGQPITDLFRLESISKNKSLNYFIESEYGLLSKEHNGLNLDKFVIKNFKTPKLQGVHFNKVRALRLKKIKV